MIVAAVVAVVAQQPQGLVRLPYCGALVFVEAMKEKREMGNVLAG